MGISRTALAVLLSLPGTAAFADDSPKGELRIGQTLPYSGPASAFGIIGQAQEAFFDKVNAEGGINGRKIKFISLDDAYSPPKTVEQTGSWSSRKTCSSCSARSAPRPTPPCTATSTARKCPGSSS